MPVLHWLGKEAAVTAQETIPFRLLDPLETVGETPHENLLIHGDNLEALKALLPYYAGKVKCVFIDPPYNTGKRIDADGAEVGYDDNLEHSIWLSMMYARLPILRQLLSSDGSIWISIDEKESHYLKLICDEIFGRQNYVVQTVIQRGGVTGHKSINPTPVQVCDLMITYAYDKNNWHYNPVYIQKPYDKAYNQYIENYDKGFEEWHFIPLKKAMETYKFTLDEALKLFPEKIIRFAQPSYDSVGQSTRDYIDQSKKETTRIFKQTRENHSDIYLFKGNRILFYRDKLMEIDGEYVTAEQVTNIWTDMNYQGIAKEGDLVFKKGKKPEAQIKRILEMCTQEGDIVLDSFLGSATTAAVALKMKRRFIGIELGNHAHTHCLPRLKKVVAGEQGGISKTVGWQGGGGFTFYTLAEPLIEPDGGIHPKVRFNHLASRLWYQESKTHAPQCTWHTPLVGITAEGTALFLLYNGILADSRWDGGNVLQEALWKETLLPLLPEGFTGKVTVYGTHCQCTEDLLKQHQITFKHTPYDVEGI